MKSGRGWKREKSVCQKYYQYMHLIKKYTKFFRVSMSNLLQQLCKFKHLKQKWAPPFQCIFCVSVVAVSFGFLVSFLDQYICHILVGFVKKYTMFCIYILKKRHRYITGGCITSLAHYLHV